LGEIGGVGQNSKGDIYVYTRTGHPYGTIGDNRTFLRNGSKLMQFDKTGKFVRELGQDLYGFNAAIGLRIDPQDNVWVIDELSNQVIKFNGATGQVALVLGRKPENILVRPGPVPGAPPAAAGGGAGTFLYCSSWPSRSRIPALSGSIFEHVATTSYASPYRCMETRSDAKLYTVSGL